MCKFSNNPEKEKELYDYFATNDYLEEYSIKQLHEAAKIALDTRKFEIELYWKRATYFWAFMIAIFSAYFLLATRQSDPNCFLLGCISFLGITFSFGWYLANRGSKYWQENWEAHIGVLIKKVAGPIFQYKLRPEYKFSNLTSNYPISVSRINQILNLFTLIIWFFLFINSILISEEYEPLRNWLIGLITLGLDTGYLLCFLSIKLLLLIIGLCWVLRKMFIYSRGGVGDDMKNHLRKNKRKGEVFIIRKEED